MKCNIQMYIIYVLQVEVPTYSKFQVPNCTCIQAFPPTQILLINSSWILLQLQTYYISGVKV